MHLTNERFATRLDTAERARSPAARSVVEVIGALLLIFQLDRVTAEAPVQHLYYSGRYAVGQRRRRMPVLRHPWCGPFFGREPR